MIRRIVSQFDGELRGLGKGYNAVEKLRAMALALWSVIQVNHQCMNMLKAFSRALPPQFQHINQTITRDFGSHTSQKQFIKLWKQNAKRSHLGLGPEIVVSCFDTHTLLASSREVSYLDCGFGIHGNAQRCRIIIGCRIDLIYLLEDGIGGCYLFFGLALATLMG